MSVVAVVTLVADETLVAVGTDVSVEWTILTGLSGWAECELFVGVLDGFVVWL